MNSALPKRLIEVDLPIKRISAHAREEKSLKGGTLSNVHIWWARRPLASCRAVICAALWPDPADGNTPKVFRDKVGALLLERSKTVAGAISADSMAVWTKVRATEGKPFPSELMRDALLAFIGDFSEWNNSQRKDYITFAHKITALSHAAIAPESHTNKPLVLDPFAGGGAIPVEALRVGAQSFASDLNPLPVLLNKLVIDYIPRHGVALIEALESWLQEALRETRKNLSPLYKSSEKGRETLAYIWARKIKCEGPGCGVDIPLKADPVLLRKGSQKIGVLFSAGKARVEFEIVTGADVTKCAPTAKRGSVTCPCCGYTTPVKSVREQLKLRAGGTEDSIMLCVIESGASKKNYRLPNKEDIECYERAREQAGQLGGFPTTKVPLMSGCFNTPLYGLNNWNNHFNSRQLLVNKHWQLSIDRFADRMSESESFKEAFSAACATVVDTLIDCNSAQCWWVNNAETVMRTFGRQGLGMVWDYCEINPLSDWARGAENVVTNVCRTLKSIAAWQTSIGDVQLASADSHPLPTDIVDAVVTDPPYYSAIPYADLSDFYLGWLSRASKRLKIPETSDKAREIVEMERWDPVRYGHKTAKWYEDKMALALAECRRVCKDTGVMVLVFAHKETAAWEALLEAVLRSEWVVTASWPISTENARRLRAQGSATLDSSVHLVCRPRAAQGNATEVGDWRDVLQELPKRIHEWMPRLANEGIVGADAIFACLGPALEVFSRYSRVEKASGDQVTLRDYLEHVWATVSKEALSSLISGTDLSSLESDARITAMWLWTLNSGSAITEDDANGEEKGEEETQEEGDKGSAKTGFLLEYDAARKIAQGLGANLEDMRSVVVVKGDEARLLPVAERTAYLFGKDQASTPENSGRGRKKKVAQMDLFTELTGAEATEAESVWEEKTVSKPGATVLDRVHQSMILFATGRGEALKRFLVEDGIGREGNFWKLAQALSALYPTGTQEKRWVDGVLARKKGLGL